MLKLSRYTTFLLLAAGFAAQFTPPTASAATIYWDTLRTGGAGGGTGAWDLSSTFWASASSGGTNGAWVDGSDAFFDGTPGTATLGAPITVGSLTFKSLANTISTTAGNPLTINGGILANISTARAINTITGAGGLVMNGNQTIELTNGLNISTVLSGSGTLTKAGAGAVGLSVASTYTGKWVVNAGLLGINMDTALGAVSASFQADAITLNGGTLLAGGVLSGPGNFNDPGPVTLNANRGIVLGASGGSIRVGYGATGLLTVNGAISGAGSLNKLDSGTLVLAGDNTYQGTTTLTAGTLILAGSNASSGAITITAGTLQVGNGGTTGSLGTGTITFGTGNGNNLNFNRSDLTVDNDIASNGRINISAVAGMRVTLNGAISGSTAGTTFGELWIHGSGTVVVNGNARSVRTTSTVVENGTLEVSDLTRTDSSALGSGFIFLGQGSTPATGAGVRYTGDSVTTDSFNSVKSQYAFIDVANVGTVLTTSNAIGGSATVLLTKRGAGTLSLSGETDNNKLRVQVDAGTLLLDKGGPASSHSVAGADALILNAGIVRITGSNGDQIYDSSTVQINGGTLDLNGHDEAFNGFTQSASSGVITNTKAGTTSKLALGASNATSVFNGKIQDGAGAMALQKAGTGALTLTGTNVLAGGTEVTNGRLIVNGSATGGLTQVIGDTTSGNFVGGTLGGTGTVGDVTTWGGVVSPGATATGAGLGTLKTGTLTMDGKGIYEVAISTSTLAASLAQIEGDLNLGFGAAVLKLTDIGPATGIEAGQVFTIMTYSGNWDFGTFGFGSIASLEDGDSFTFGVNTYKLDYDFVAHDGDTIKEVRLTVTAPEPATGGLFLGGLAMLASWRQRRKPGHASTRLQPSVA